MKEAILYSTGCPRCEELKSALDEENISYTVETDVDKMINLGFSEVPMLAIHGKTLDFNQAIRFINERKINGGNAN